MQTGSNKKLFLFTILLLGSYNLLNSAPGQQRADFLIIENPGALKIYNKYEQQITNNESLLFESYCALRLISTNITLSDNFTLADKIKLSDDYFYLLKDNKQSLRISQSPGYLKEFHKVLLIEDTVIVSENSRLYLQLPSGTSATSAASKIPLAEGTRLHRLFENKNLTYIRILDASSRYGWVNLTDKSSWRKEDHRSVGTDLQKCFTRIMPVFDRYNNLYQQLFQYFNAHTGTNYPVPRWQLELKNKQINAVLLNASSADQFRNSYPYLLNELHQELINTGLHVIVMDKVIEIK
jgi:hypothetical protein